MSLQLGAVGEEDAAGDVGDAGVHDRPGDQRQVVFGGVVGGARALAELQPAVAVVAEGHLGAAHVEVGVGLRVELGDVVGVVRAGADLDGGAERGLAERRVGVEAEAGARGVVVDDEDVGGDAVVDHVEGRVDLAGERQRAAALVDPGEALGHHLRLGAVVLVRPAPRRARPRPQPARRPARRGRGAAAAVRSAFSAFELGPHRVDLLLLRLDHRHHPVDVGGARLLGEGGRAGGERKQGGGGEGSGRSCRGHAAGSFASGLVGLRGRSVSGPASPPLRSIRSPRKAKAIETSGLRRLKKAKGT